MNQFLQKNSNKNIEKHFSLGSLILGIISLGGNLSLILMYKLYLLPEQIPFWIEVIIGMIARFGWVVLYFYLLGGKILEGIFVIPFIIPILGLILGFLSRKEKLAKFGIKLCFIGLVSAIIAIYIMSTTPI